MDIKLYNNFLNLFKFALFFAFFAIITTISVPLGLIALLFAISFFCYKSSGKKFEVILFSASVIIGTSFVFTLDVMPFSDFEAVLNASRMLLDGDTSFQTFDYFVSYPYQTFMVIYEAILLSIWDDIKIIQLVNVLFLAGTNVLCYKIACIYFDEKASRAVSIFHLIYIFHMSFVVVLANQIQPSFFIYLAIYMLASERFDKLSSIKKYALVGFLLAVSNLFRQDGIVIIVAVLAFVFFEFIKDANKKNFVVLVKKIAPLLVLYFGTFELCSMTVKLLEINANGLENNATLLRFIIGFNQETNGGWNSYDAIYVQTVMESQGLSQTEAELAILAERIFISPLSLMSLFYNKITFLWTGDTAFWTFSTLADLEPKAYELLKNVNSSVNIISIFGAILGSAYLIFRKNVQPKSLILPFYIFATFCAYIPMEVQPRYLYTVQFSLFILTVGAVEFVFNKVKKK